jgi:hypothetical protein
MREFKKIIVRLCLLTGIVALLNICYKKTFWKDDLDKHSDMLWEQLNQQYDKDILYYGESSNFATDSNDVCKKSISDLAAEFYPGLKLGTVGRPAMHAGIYLAVIRKLSPTTKVKTIIVTLNMRSFGADWIHSHLESYLMKTKIMYQPYPDIANRFLLSLNAFENKTEKQREKDKKAQWAREQLVFPYPFKYKNVIDWNRAMAYGGYLKPDGTWDTPKIELACHYIKTYGFQINTSTNPRIKDFDEIVNVCKAKKINVVFNLLAENVQHADSLVGKDLIFLMKQNRDLLVDRYSKMGVIVVDNLELVNDKEFIDQNWTTEHYKENGRKIIAKNLAEKMKKIYPANFVNRLNICGQ